VKSDLAPVLSMSTVTVNCNIARIVRRAGSMKRPSVRPSVRLSVPSFDHSRGVAGFAAERRTGRIHRSTAAAARRPAPAQHHKAAARRSAANASSATLAADVGS